MTAPTSTAYLLAYEFASLLRNMLSAETMEAINRRNSAAGNDFACATHDFCDSNEVMLQAMANIDMEEFQPENREQADLMSAAWGVAKRLRFDVQTIGAEARATYPGWPADAAATMATPEDAQRAEQRADMTAEHLDQAHSGAEVAVTDLMAANRWAGPVESLLILPLIGRMRVLQQEIAAIRDAVGAARRIAS